ncbi:hypothetical protein LXA43DRAFT_465834 [Ganoderma leucocontextum]|nr:hypothetical protein LXA43DRAFT_465834 [Ganoderma leucocontextum]
MESPRIGVPYLAPPSLRQLKLNFNPRRDICPGEIGRTLAQLAAASPAIQKMDIENAHQTGPFPGLPPSALLHLQAYIEREHSAVAAAAERRLVSTTTGGPDVRSRHQSAGGHGRRQFESAGGHGRRPPCSAGCRAESREAPLRGDLQRLDSAVHPLGGAIASRARGLHRRATMEAPLRRTPRSRAGNRTRSKSAIPEVQELQRLAITRRACPRAAVLAARLEPLRSSHVDSPALRHPPPTLP